MFHSGSARSVSWPIVLTGGISSLVLALGMAPTFASFTASISNSLNVATLGTLVMQESNETGTVTCLSTDDGGLLANVASCSANNKYGEQTPLASGGTVTLTHIRNVGSVDAAAFDLSPEACVQSAAESGTGTATDLCAKVTVTITCGVVSIFSGTAAALGVGGPIDVLAKLGLTKLAPGAELSLSITAKIDDSITNAYQGLRLSQPMTWTFSS